MLDYRELEQQLNQRGWFARVPRREAATLLASHQDEDAARILAKAIINTNDNVVKEIAFGALTCWSTDVVLRATELIWRDSADPILGDVITRHVIDLPEPVQMEWADMSDEQWGPLARRLVDKTAWGLLWRICRIVSPRRALPLLVGLGRSGWQPLTDRVLFQQLIQAAQACHNQELPPSWRLYKLMLYNNIASYDTCYFTDDGRHLISQHRDEAFMWELPNMNCVAHLPFSKSQWARHSAMARSSRQLWVTSSEKPQVTLFDFAAPKKPLMTLDNRASVTAIAVSPDGQTAFHATKAGKINVWNVALQKKTAEIPFTNGQMTQLLLSPNGQWLAGVVGKRICLWALPDMQHVRDLEADEKAAWIQFSPDSQQLMATYNSYREGMRLWQLSSGRCTWHITRESSCPMFAFLPDGQHVLCANSDKKVRLYQIGQQAPLEVADIKARKIIYHPHKPLWVISNNSEIFMQLWGISNLRTLLKKPIVKWSSSDVRSLNEDNGQQPAQMIDHSEIAYQHWLTYCRALTWVLHPHDVMIDDV